MKLHTKRASDLSITYPMSLLTRVTTYTPSASQSSTLYSSNYQQTMKSSHEHEIYVAPTPILSPSMQMGSLINEGVEQAEVNTAQISENDNESNTEKDLEYIKNKTNKLGLSWAKFSTTGAGLEHSFGSSI